MSEKTKKPKNEKKEKKNAPFVFELQVLACTWQGREGKYHINKGKKNTTTQKTTS
jgi:hypothetical protein